MSAGSLRAELARVEAVTAEVIRATLAPEERPAFEALWRELASTPAHWPEGLPAVPAEHARRLEAYLARVAPGAIAAALEAAGVSQRQIEARHPHLAPLA